MTPVAVVVVVERDPALVARLETVEAALADHEAQIAALRPRLTGEQRALLACVARNVRRGEWVLLSEAFDGDRKMAHRAGIACAKAALYPEVEGFRFIPGELDDGTRLWMVVEVERGLGPPALAK